MADRDDDFDAGDAGSSLTFPLQCSSLRKNGHVCLKGRPCKIVEMSTSKTGKHGSAKVHLVAIDIFTGKKYEEICPSSHNMDVPNVKRQEYMLSDVQDGYLSLMDDSGSLRDDIPLPNNEIGKKITSDVESSGILSQDNTDQTVVVTIMSAMGEEHAISSRVVTDKDKESR